jgi:two-component system CheB/CheR fusion protein
MSNEDNSEAFEALLDYLKRSRGFDFNGYKRPSLTRRVRKRLETLGIPTFEEYVDYLEVHPGEFAELFNTILINVTSFFRDQAAWDYLSVECIPRLLSQKGPDDPIRIWSAGCASGEEAYSLAILTAEAVGPDAFRHRVKIYASDVDEQALAEARQASFSDKDIQAIDENLRKKYFDQVEDRYTFNSDLRRAVIFGRHDLTRDAPISKLDLLSCRNTLMYFNSETQGQILSRFHFAVTPGGYLFLGKAEMMLTHANLFTPVDLKHRIFSKVPQTDLRYPTIAGAQADPVDLGDSETRRLRLRDLAFDSTPVAQVAVDMSGCASLINERARTLLNLSNRDVGRPFRDLEISYRPLELRSLIERAYSELHPVKVANVARYSAGGEVMFLDVEVAPLQEDSSLLMGACISFYDVTRRQQLQEELQRANQELETAYEELQSTYEELETTNEELQSTNEELETTNEELQSTNEEMETMNEELQSTNEELQTINDELRVRTDELNVANSFLQSILASLRSAVVVVDPKTNVVNWNAHAGEMWGLRAEDVQGVPFLNLDIGLPVEQLKAPLRDCLVGEVDFQEIVVDAVNRRGKRIKCQIVCTPLLGDNKERTGALLLMGEVDGKAEPGLFGRRAPEF